MTEDAYRAYTETDEYGRIAAPLCGDCLPDDADILGHISDGRHYGEEGVEQPKCYTCEKEL